MEENIKYIEAELTDEANTYEELQAVKRIVTRLKQTKNTNESEVYHV